MDNKQAKKFCPNGSPHCTGGSDCGYCGGHICSHHAAAHDIKTGRIYHVWCVDRQRGNRN